MLAFIAWHYFWSNPFVLGFLLSAIICLVLALVAGIVIWAVFFETSRRYEDMIVALEKSLDLYRVQESTPSEPPPIKNHEGGVRLLSQTVAAQPLVSIISVVFRDKTELRALIDNLAPFRNGELELIVIDGASDDGTLGVLQEHDGSIDYWLSESDQGIYDAMNKGLKAARGRWVIHINAGDRLLDVPYDRLREVDSTADVLCCRVQCEDLLFMPRVNWTSRFQNTWQHQGTFYRREALGEYDTTYRVLGDFAANQRLIRQGKRVAISTVTAASHQNGGLSDRPGALSEEGRSIRENFGLTHQLIHVALFKPTRRVYRSMRMAF